GAGVHGAAEPAHAGGLSLLLPPDPAARGPDRVRPSVGLYLPARVGQGVPRPGRARRPLPVGRLPRRRMAAAHRGDRGDPLGLGVSGSATPTGRGGFKTPRGASRHRSPRAGPPGARRFATPARATPTPPIRSAR